MGAVAQQDSHLWVHTAVDLVHFNVVICGVLTQAVTAGATVLYTFQEEARHNFLTLAETVGCTVMPLSADATGSFGSRINRARSKGVEGRVSPLWWMGEWDLAPRDWELLHPQAGTPQVVFGVRFWSPARHPHLLAPIRSGYSSYITGTSVLDG
jgi:hypothetical protein